MQGRDRERPQVAGAAVFHFAPEAHERAQHALQGQPRERARDRDEQRLLQRAPDPQLARHRALPVERLRDDDRRLLHAARERDRLRYRNQPNRLAAVARIVVGRLRRDDGAACGRKIAVSGEQRPADPRDAVVDRIAVPEIEHPECRGRHGDVEPRCPEPDVLGDGARRCEQDAIRHGCSRRLGVAVRDRELHERDDAQRNQQSREELEAKAAFSRHRRP